jgi:hypothetical protein
MPVVIMLSVIMPSVVAPISDPNFFDGLLIGQLVSNLNRMCPQNVSRTNASRQKDPHLNCSSLPRPPVRAFASKTKVLFHWLGYTNEWVRSFWGQCY